MRQANIFYKNDLAGVLTENDAGYEFRYLPENVSLYETAGKIRLTPAYDLLNAVILNPKDDEELALTLNGRKKKLQRDDFIKSAANLGIESVVVKRLINKYIKLFPKFELFIQKSFLSDGLKETYNELLRERIDRLCR